MEKYAKGLSGHEVVHFAFLNFLEEQAQGGFCGQLPVFPSQFSRGEGAFLEEIMSS